MRLNPSILLLLNLACWVFFPTRIEGAGQKPLFTESAVSLPPGVLEAQLGVEFLRNQSFPFSTPSTDFNRDLWKIPALGLHLGLDRRTELQLDYDLLYLNEEEPGVGQKFGSGDLRIFTKIQILRDTPTHPALALRIGTKLPNANDEARLGTNETDFLSALLVTKFYQRMTFHANAGFAILGSPNQPTLQDDLLLFGFAALLPAFDAFHWVMEVEGRALSRKNNDVVTLRLGFQIKTGEVQWYWGGGVGLTDQAADWGILGGLTWQKKLWEK